VPWIHLEGAGLWATEDVDELYIGDEKVDSRFAATLGIKLCVLDQDEASCLCHLHPQSHLGHGCTPWHRFERKQGTA
jgi:hypothetical protein